MNDSRRELWICLFVGGIGSLISVLLYRSQLIDYFGIPLLITVLSIISIGALILAILVVLRDYPKVPGFLGRMGSLAIGMVCMRFLLEVAIPLVTTPLSLRVLIALLFGPIGFIFLTFGLFLDRLLSKWLGISRWWFYRHVARVCCMSIGLSPIVALIVNSVTDKLPVYHAFIIYSFVIVSVAIGMFSRIEQDLYDR
jgi:hypothetical protein